MRIFDQLVWSRKNAAKTVDGLNQNQCQNEQDDTDLSEFLVFVLQYVLLLLAAVFVNGPGAFIVPVHSS